jgi:hypothetical protein
MDQYLLLSTRGRVDPDRIIVYTLLLRVCDAYPPFFSFPFFFAPNIFMLSIGNVQVFISTVTRGAA